LRAFLDFYPAFWRDILHWLVAGDTCAAQCCLEALLRLFRAKFIASLSLKGDSMRYAAEYPHDPRLDPYLTAIGIVATAYAQLEYSMSDAIWELANVSRMAGICMTGQMFGPGPRNRCLLALLELRKAPEALITEFNQVGKKIEGVAAKRNRFVHDHLVIDKETGEVRRLQATADRHVQHGFMQTEIDELTQLANQIDAVTNDFDTLITRALSELPPWPRTQFSQSEGIQLHRTIGRTDR
jgi:hypothetical protein